MSIFGIGQCNALYVTYIPCTFNTTVGLNITSAVPLSILHCTAELLFSTEARTESMDVLIPPIPKVVCDISRWAREMSISSINWICHRGCPPWTLHLKRDIEPRDAFIDDGISMKPTWISVVQVYKHDYIQILKYLTFTYVHSGLATQRPSRTAVSWWRYSSLEPVSCN